MKLFYIILLCFIFFILSSSCSLNEVDKKESSKNWIAQSNKIARQFAKEYAAFYPESISDLGLYISSDITHYSKDLEKTFYRFLNSWREKINLLLIDITNKDVQSDLRILLNKINTEIDVLEVNDESRVIPFIPITEFIYKNLKENLKVDSSVMQKKNGIDKFYKYVNGSKRGPSLYKGVKELMSGKIQMSKVGFSKIFWPSRYEILQYLNNSDDYLESIKKILSQQYTSWRKDFAKLVEQDMLFRNFLKVEILPFSRQEYILPEKIYTNYLKTFGVDLGPTQLIHLARKDYQFFFEDFVRRAKKIAEKYKLTFYKPSQVVSFISSKENFKTKDLINEFSKINNNLFWILKKSKMISIKNKPHFKIRFASSAESKSIPAPFFIPSPLVGSNKNKTPQFVIIRPDEGRVDFKFRGAMIHLTAHETIPGHGIQYQFIKEQEISIIRSWLGMTSANSEGWALYAEDLVFPFLDEDTQFIFLQRKLWRIARSFLDPQLNLGQIDQQMVFHVYRDELGFSDAFVKSEIDRSIYIMPGQATSYYFGYKQILKLKNNFTKRLGRDFTEKCFNDSILSYGTLPFDDISARLDKIESCVP